MAYPFLAFIIPGFESKTIHDFSQNIQNTITTPQKKFLNSYYQNGRYKLLAIKDITNNH